MFKNSFGLLVCLFGLILVCRAAPSAPPAGSPPSGSTPPAGGPPSDVPPPLMDGDGDDDENEEDYYDGEEYADEDYSEEDYEEDDEDMSPEEMLSELAEEHYEVKQDCDYLKQMMSQAKQANATAPVDPELQQSYDECREYLKEVEQEMQQVEADLANGEDDDSEQS